MTGLTTQVIELTGKTFEILSEIYPDLRRIAVINPIGAGVDFRPAEAEAALSDATKASLAELTDDVDIKVFSTPT